LSAKPPVKPALKTPSRSLASVLKQRMSRTSPRREMRIWASLLLASLELLRLGASEGASCSAGRVGVGAARRGRPASSGSHPRSSPSGLQKKQARLAQRLRRWMAHLVSSVRIVTEEWSLKRVMQEILEANQA
jgi:hypothetical protein